MFLKMHKVAAALALLLIGGFWLASAAAELSGSVQAIVTVKTAILIGVFALIPAMAITGYSGSKLAGRRKHERLASKLKRIRLMAAIGISLLVPLAGYLWWKASHSQFDTWFYIAQAIEFAAGAVNLTLGVMNVRAGSALKAARNAA